MPSPRTELFAGRSFVVEIEGARGPRAEVRSTFDVSRLPGAKLVASGAWETPDARLIGGCVSGPSERFVDGIEDVLFEKATWLSMRTLESEPASLTIVREPTTSVPHVRERLMKGTSTASRPLIVHHVLAFDGDDRELVLCSIACEGACDDAALVIEGTAHPPPAPSWMMRAGLAAAASPSSAAMILAAVALVVAGVIVWRRPRRP